MRRLHPSRLAPLLALSLVAAACTSPIPNRDPAGEPFPAVRAETLDGDPLRLPGDLAGAPAVLLVGYEQDAQFDADRWLLGLLRAGPPAAVYEVPTIRGWAPRLFASRIDQGMRDGIPPEDWATVATVYDDAAEVAAFTGTELGNNMRVLLLDRDGTVAWFHDRGYSARVLLELLDAARALDPADAPAR